MQTQLTLNWIKRKQLSLGLKSGISPHPTPIVRPGKALNWKYLNSVELNFRFFYLIFVSNQRNLHHFNKKGEGRGGVSKSNRKRRMSLTNRLCV